MPDRMTVGQDVGDKENHSKMVQQLRDGSMVEVRVDKVTRFYVFEEMGEEWSYMIELCISVKLGFGHPCKFAEFQPGRDVKKLKRS